MRELIPHATALGGGNVLVMRLVDRVEQVQVDAVVDVEGIYELGDHF
jgi:hypothetical protein